MADAASLCREDPRFAQFDFWVGDWRVYANGKPVGRNTITRDANGCVVREHWVNDGGTAGYSLRYFNPLSGEINYFATNLTMGFRVRFTDNQDGTVRQYAEQRDAETGAWTEWFDGVYKRLADSAGET